MPEIKIAEELSGQHIGREIQFPWKFPRSAVEANVWGELREVHHDAGDEIVVWLASLSEDMGGEKSEFVVRRGTKVTVV
ncbi:hypothetical protein ASE48_08585 [Mycobacterium sp. Root265]|uniref:hypothetical protein n=1 Tax=Mycobacterium sp. Root265 TaxID=1736504 RepID=UPI00070E13E4|nr:hypothetical protein [Mycobacterium sp. Root265]KRD08610.1 hypothetical protein ASE48_08585 [Mycobacterium sp. Root265]